MQSIFRNLVTLSLLLFSTTIQAQSSLSETDTLPWIHFSWSSDILSGRLVEKTAMNVPFIIDGMPYAFDAQFDLGAVSTMIYGETFAPYLAKNPGLQEKLDPTQTVLIEGSSCPYFVGLSIRLDSVEFPNQRVALFKDFGDVMTEDSIRTSTTKHIGTIAADLFNQKILVIDYKNERLCSVESLPSDWGARVEFVEMEYIAENNWIFLPLQIGGTIRKVVFDTGASLFPLVSSPSKIAQISCSNHCVDSLRVSSWGNEEIVYGYAPEVNISLGAIKFPSLPVYSSPGLDDESLDSAGFWGIVGNRYFLDRIIIIDYKNRKFGIFKTNDETGS